MNIDPHASSAPRERRASTRVAVNFLVRYATINTDERTARVTEISRTGLRLQTEETLDLHQTVAIAFGHDFPAAELHLHAEVIRQTSIAGSPYEYGLQITSGLAISNMLGNAIVTLSTTAE